MPNYNSKDGAWVETPNPHIPKVETSEEKRARLQAELDSLPKVEKKEVEKSEPKPIAPEATKPKLGKTKKVKKED